MDRRIEINGSPATADDLAPLALVNYGHFTYMQARDHAVRGLDLHLDRLERATVEMFGRGLDGDRVRGYVRGALEHTSGGDATVRVGVFSRNTHAVTSGAPAEPEIMVAIGAPASAQSAPQRLCTVEHERLLPHLKHVGTMGLIHHGRRARQVGYDDALFTDRTGRVTEATIANICFYDGDRFLWPSSPALPGIMKHLLLRGMDKLGVPYTNREVRRSELSGFATAFLTNSVNPALPVASVDDVAFSPDRRARDTLVECYAAHPWQPV